MRLNIGNIFYFAQMFILQLKLKEENSLAKRTAHAHTNYMGNDYIILLVKVKDLKETF